jgi:hypothetical protein
MWGKVGITVVVTVMVVLWVGAIYVTYWHPEPIHLPHLGK